MAKFDQTMSDPNLKLGSAGGYRSGESSAASLAQGVSDLAGLGAAYVQQKRRDRFGEELANARQQDKSAFQEGQVAIQELQRGLPRTNEEFIALGDDTPEAREFHAKWKRIDQLRARNSTLAGLKQRQLIAEYSTRYPMQENVWKAQLAKDNGTFEYMREISEAAPTREERYRNILMQHSEKNGWSMHTTAQVLAAEEREKTGSWSANETAMQKRVGDDLTAQYMIHYNSVANTEDFDSIHPEQHKANLEYLLDNWYSRTKNGIEQSGMTEDFRVKMLKQLKSNHEIQKKIRMDLLESRLNGEKLTAEQAEKNIQEARNSEMSSYLLDEGLHGTRAYYDNLSPA